MVPRPSAGASNSGFSVVIKAEIFLLDSEAHRTPQRRLADVRVKISLAIDLLDTCSPRMMRRLLSMMRRRLRKNGTRIFARMLPM